MPLSHKAKYIPPKVALLFLTIGDHEHAALWKTFLTNHMDQYSVYCHPAEADRISQQSILRRTPTQSKHEGILPKHKCIRKPNNRWGHLVLAYYQLLHQAYHDAENNNQRFVFLSETCVPCASADDVYRRLTTNLNVTYMDAQYEHENIERYDQPVAKPWRNRFPVYSKKKRKLQRHSKRNRTVSCAVYFRQHGILREHFFKHSGWFSPNRDATQKLLKHKGAFEALNMTSAGDEHILSILKRDEYKDNTLLENKKITFVSWDHVKMKEWERMKKEESVPGFWEQMDKMKQTDPKRHANYIETRDACKNANMHPLEYKVSIKKNILRQCNEHKSCFIRKVRQTCDVQNIIKILHDLEKVQVI